MSDTVKLVIEVPKKDYEWAKEIKASRDEKVYCERQIIAIANATPLSEVLDEIKEEFIERYPKNYMGEPELNGSSCAFSLNKVLKIIDKHIGREGIRNEIRNHSRNEFGKSY